MYRAFVKQVVGRIVYTASTRNVHAVVSVDWLHENFITKGNKNIKVVHAVSHSQDFDEAHIPGATCFNMSICRDTSSPLPNTLPTAEDFENYVNENLQATNNDHVVIYDSNAEAPSLFPGARVWFMFRIFGHDKTSLLSGGLYRWLQEGRPISKHSIMPRNKRESGAKFKAKFQPELLVSFEDVLKNVETKHYQLVDARGSARFLGQADDPYGKSGHIPGSINMPYSILVDKETKLLLNPEQMEALFNEAKVSLKKPLITSCGSGVTACATYFAASVCGKRDAKLYNGSWSEWIQRVDDRLVATG